MTRPKPWLVEAIFTGQPISHTMCGMYDINEANDEIYDLMDSGTEGDRDKAILAADKYRLLLKQAPVMMWLLRHGTEKERKAFLKEVLPL